MIENLIWEHASPSTGRKCAKNAYWNVCLTFYIYGLLPDLPLQNVALLALEVLFHSIRATECSLLRFGAIRRANGSAISINTHFYLAFTIAV